MDSLSIDAPIVTRAGVLQSPNLVSWIALSLSLVQFALFGWHWFLPGAVPAPGWMGELFLVLVAISTLCSMARQLPWQNVLSIAVIIPSLAAVLELAGIPTGIRFGLDHQTRGFGQSFSIHQTGLAVLVWIVAILNCRGVARLVMRRWRTASAYGFWLLGITVLLVVGLILKLESSFLLAPLYSKTFGANSPYEFGVGISAGAAVISAIILLAITPTLINKKPGTEVVNWHPLILWALLTLGSFSNALGQRAALAAGVILFEFLLVITFIARRPIPATPSTLPISFSVQDGHRPTSS